MTREMIIAAAYAAGYDAVTLGVSEGEVYLAAVVRL